MYLHVCSIKERLLEARRPDDRDESSDPPSAFATTESAALRDMFSRLDALCGELGDTLFEVVVALAKHDEQVDADDRIEAQQNAILWDALRGSMPRMVGRRCLRVRRDKSGDYFRNLAKRVFERDPLYWQDIKPDQ